MSGGVYKITCVPTGRFYIGSTYDFDKRFYWHRCELSARRHHSRALQSAWAKHSPDAFSFDVLVVCDDRASREAVEQRLLDEMLPFGRRGFNSCPTVGSTRGRRLSAEHKNKISAAKKGRVPNWAGGWKPRSGFGGEGSQNPMFGRKQSASAKAAMAAANGLPVAEYTKDGVLIAVYPSASAAARTVGASTNSNILSAVNGRVPTAMGSLWRRFFDRPPVRIEVANV